MKRIIYTLIFIALQCSILYATEIPQKPQQGLKAQNYICTYKSLDYIAPIINSAKNSIAIKTTTITNNQLLSQLIAKNKTCKITILLDNIAKTDNNLIALLNKYRINYLIDSQHKINDNYIIIDNLIVIFHSKYFGNVNKAETTNTIAIYGNKQITAYFINDFNNHTSHAHR